jgi:predicted metal-binding protein
MNDVPSPVSEALILVCEKCGKKLVSGDEENPSRTLQTSLKEKIKEEHGKGKFRAVITSCMDICPKDEIAVAIVRPSKSSNDSATESKDEFFTVIGETESLRDDILARAKKS